MNCLKWSPPPQDTVNQKEKSKVNDPSPSASKSKRGKSKEKVYVEVQRSKARVALVENKVPEAGKSSSEIAENSAPVAGVYVPVQLAPCELATVKASGALFHHLKPPFLLLSHLNSLLHLSLLLLPFLVDPLNVPDHLLLYLLL